MPSTTRVSFVNAFKLSFDVAFAVSRRIVCLARASAPKRRAMSSTSRRVYQTSNELIPANDRIARR